MLDFRRLDLIAELIVACEPPPKGGPGHPRSEIVRVVATLRRFLREGLPWRSLRATIEQVSGSTLQRFHAAGNAAYPDWKKRCADLIRMGCDPELSELLIARPDGVRLVATLAGDPKSLAAIANLQTAAARSTALANFAASLADRERQSSPQAASYKRPILNWEAAIMAFCVAAFFVIGGLVNYFQIHIHL